MTRGMKSTLAAAFVVLVLSGASSAMAEVPVAEYDGWKLSADARLATFLSVGTGDALPDDQQDQVGAGTIDTADSTGSIQSVRIRNGFMMSILGVNARKQVLRDLKVTTRVGLWMNITGTRSKNNSAQIDPRELYGKLEGPWGSFLAGSDLALFGRGGILVDAAIAHDYGLGYPCSIFNASGGGCGMTVFGATFPGFEPGLVYATPPLVGLQFSLGLYDPADDPFAQLNRSPLPRFEAEAKYDYKDNVRIFGSGFWQVMEGTIPDPAVVGGKKNLHTDAWGVQAGAMLALGPIMLGGAAMQGTGLGPITHVETSILASQAGGVLRKSRGAFGLGAVLIEPAHLKIAGGAGVWKLDKNPTESGPQGPTGAPANPQLIKQNLGMTVGAYQTTGPVHFALEYFRAQHTWYERGLASPVDPTMTASIVTPKQVLHFINAGMTVAW